MGSLVAGAALAQANAGIRERAAPCRSREAAPTAPSRMAAAVTHCARCLERMWNNDVSEAACASFVSDLLDEDHWYSLVSTVSEGVCTLMLGPEAVTGCLNGERLPVHVALASYMMQRLPEDVRHRLGPSDQRLDPWHPASVAQVILREADPAQIRRWLERFHEDFETDDQPLVDLAKLPFALVLNTSPAKIVFDVFSRVKSGAIAAFYDRTGKMPGMLPDLSPANPVVYQLYGSLEKPRSMILSDSDRLDFIVKLARGSPALPINLTSALSDEDRIFLFLGFDLTDWHLRVLLHILSSNANRNYTSFAAELESAPLDLETQDFYRVSHKIHFFAGDLATFCSELKERTESRRAGGNEHGAGRAVSPNAPVVFICHASEDAGEARRIAAGLRAAGIGTWVDRQNLRGGDRWDDMIERTIKKEVDYVAVLQSAAMKSKDVGYVNREIDMALDRQRDYRLPRVFLIPAIIDDAMNRLDALEIDRLQSVDLTPTAGVGDLVRAIVRDLDLQGRGLG